MIAVAKWLNDPQLLKSSVLLNSLGLYWKELGNEWTAEDNDLTKNRRVVWDVRLIHTFCYFHFPIPPNSSRRSLPHHAHDSHNSTIANTQISQDRSKRTNCWGDRTRHAHNLTFTFILTCDRIKSYTDWVQCFLVVVLCLRRVFFNRLFFSSIGFWVAFVT